MNAGGEPFAVVQALRRFTPEAVGYLSDLRFFMPSLATEELRGNRYQCLYPSMC